jgi:hypothetical protein
MKTTIALAAVLVALGSFPADAQRYDSSYGYEMRGFVPPSPFASRLFRERDWVAEPVPREQGRQQRERARAREQR